MSFWNKILNKETLQEPLEKIDEKPVHNLEIQDALNSYVPALAELNLYEIKDNAEIVHTYLKYLVRDLGEYVHGKTEKRKETTKKRIQTRIKMLTNHGLELKNLLGHLESHYYQPLIEIFSLVYKRSHDKEVESTLNDLEEDLEDVRELDGLLTRVIGYGTLFSPEKNPDFEKDIEREVNKEQINLELQELAKKIQKVVIDFQTGLNSRINEKILEPFKQKF